MANLSPAAYAKKHARTGDRIARRAARLRNTSASKQGLNPSTGPSLASQIASALKRPGVIAVGRPSTAEGVSAFHFSVKPITKGSEATALAGGTARPGAARAHQRYVEREGAAEKTLADIDVDHFAIEQQQYLERPEAVEQGHVLASFGNISDIYEERMEFWRLAEESEYAPKSHVMTFNPGYDAEFWKAVDTPALNAPAQLIDAARDKSTELAVDDPTAAAILRFFNAHRSPGNEKSPAVGIEIGRGGRIQTRIIAELPHEVSAEKRMQIARDFCEARIANIEPPDTEGRWKGIKKTLRYWAVIHAPDSGNDNRNNHLHVVFYERPTDKMLDPATGQMQWDFAIVTQERDSKRTLRVKRKEEKNRGRIVHHKSWTAESRAYFATLVNAALAEAGVKRRVDARSYAKIGIDEKPVKRMEPKAYQKEKQGIPTSAGEQTIADQWDRELKRLTRLYDTVVFDNAVVDRFNAAADRFKSKLHTSTTEVEKTFDRWAKAVVAKRGVLAERAAVLFNVAKIRSRLTPPLDHRSKAEIAATKAVIDELQKDELTPLNQLYRAALVKEKDVLTALAKLERAYSSTPQASPAAPPIAPSVLKIKTGVAPPTPAVTQQSRPQIRSRVATIATMTNSGAPALNNKPARSIAPTAAPPPVLRSAPPRRTYGSIPGIGTLSPQIKPMPKFNPAFDDAALYQMAATRIRQHNEYAADWHRRHDAFKAPFEKSVASISGQAIATGNPAAAIDAMYARRKAEIKEAEEADAIEALLPEFDNLIRDRLRKRLSPYLAPDISEPERRAINDRLYAIAADADPITSAAAKAAIAAISQSSPVAQAPAAKAPVAQPPQPAPPTVEAAPAPKPASAEPTPTAENKTPSVIAPEQKIVEPPPAEPAKRPIAPKTDIYRRRVRQLTPDERSALTKEHVSSKPKPIDDIPESMPAHARPRRPQLHDEPLTDNAAAKPAAAPTAPPESRHADVPPVANPKPIAVANPAPAAQPPIPINAEVAKAAAPPAAAPAPTPTPTAEAAVEGATIDIKAAPGVKRRKKKASELSPEERRRLAIARQKSRGQNGR
jgi:hypothetical protein